MPGEPSGPERCLVVWCLDWPVVALGLDPETPAAVVHANRIIAATPAARNHGVSRGMRRRSAQGRCGSLALHDRDQLREARAFEAVVAVVADLTPRVEITRPGLCALSTRGPARYFGGVERVVERLAERVPAAVDQPFTCRIGVADGRFAAGLAARSTSATNGSHIVADGETPGFLAPLPITTLEHIELTDVLLRLGLTTLGSFAALAPSDVIARFGASGMAAHRLASGVDAHPPEVRVPPPDLALSTEIDPPAERVDRVVFAARVLAETLNDELERRGVACTQVSIEAETEHGERQLRLWRHEGALSVAAITDQVRWQLDGWLNGPVAGRPSAGVTRVSLAPDEVMPATGRQLGFWGGATAADDRAVRALVRVEGLLGPESVSLPEWRGGRGVGDQLALVPLQSVDPVERSLGDDEERARAPWPGRLPRPWPAQVGGGRPGSLGVVVLDHDDRRVGVTGRGELTGNPATVVIEGERHDLDAWAGPWPIEERWWDADRYRRRARLQVTSTTGRAWMLSVEAGAWGVEATYD